MTGQFRQMELRVEGFDKEPSSVVWKLHVLNREVMAGGL